MKTQQTVPQIFAHKEFGQVRVIIIDGEPRFCLSDVCKILDLRVAKIVERLDKDVLSKDPLETAGGVQEMYFVNEDGFYDVIIDSRKPWAKRLRKWLTKEVMPSLRKHGYYAVPGRSEYFELNNVMSAKFLVVIEDVKSLNQVCYDLKAKQKRMSEISEELLELDSDCKVLEVKKQELIEKLDESMQEFFGLGRKLNTQDKDLIDIKSKEELS